MGDGPSRSVYQGALEIRLKDIGRWQEIQGGAYRSLDMTLPANLLRPTTRLDFQTDGVLTALVMVQLLLEPYPVNPFLVYAAFFDNDLCLDFFLQPYQDYLPEHLLAMILDKETRDLVANVLKLTPKQLIDINSPLVERAITSEIPQTLLFRERNDWEHDAVVRPLLSLLLLGHHQAWTRCQFQDFQKGLRLGVCYVDDIVKVG